MRGLYKHCGKRAPIVGISCERVQQGLHVTANAEFNRSVLNNGTATLTSRVVIVGSAQEYAALYATLTKVWLLCGCTPPVVPIARGRPSVKAKLLLVTTRATGTTIERQTFVVEQMATQLNLVRGHGVVRSNRRRLKSGRQVPLIRARCHNRIGGLPDGTGTKQCNNQQPYGSTPNHDDATRWR